MALSLLMLLFHLFHGFLVVSLDSTKLPMKTNASFHGKMRRILHQDSSLLSYSQIPVRLLGPFSIGLVDLGMGRLLAMFLK
jgi:hypothetical protein